MANTAVNHKNKQPVMRHLLEGIQLVVQRTFACSQSALPATT